MAERLCLLLLGSKQVLLRSMYHWRYTQHVLQPCPDGTAGHALLCVDLDAFA